MIRKIKALLKKTFIYPIYIFFKTLPKKIKDKWNKFYIHKIKYPRIYKKYSKLPVDENKIIFVEVRLPSVSNSFKVIYDELANNYNYTIHVHFLRNLFTTRKLYNQRSAEMIKDLATAKYVFIDEASSVTSCIKMRPETIFTQLWHGCGAFKKFGTSTADLIFGSTREMLKKYPNYGNYSHVTVSSPEIVWAYEEAMEYQDKPGIVKPVGSSRTDIFYDKDFIESAYKKLHKVMPQSEGKKVILYAPTFRGRVAKAQTSRMLSVKMFEEAFSDEYVLLFKHHPLVRKPPVISISYADFAKDVTDSMSIEELLCVSDICISDYSSLIFEYSLFERPLIFFAYDLDEYFDWRGFYYDYFELTPGPICTTNNEMIDYIKNIDTRFDKQKVHDFREKFMSSCDGHATQRIMDMVFGDTLEKHRKPESERTNYPLNIIPDCTELFSATEKKYDDLEQFRNKARQFYQNGSLREIDSKKVTVISGGDCTQMFSDALEKDGSFNVCRVEETPEAAQEIANSRYVVCQGNSDLLSVLDLRKGTDAIALTSETIPVMKTGYASIKYKAGYERERCAIAPLCGKYSIIPVASDFAAKALEEVYNVSDNSVFKKIGCVHTDAYFNNEFIKASRAKIEELYPNAKGKKIIFYKPVERIDKVTRPAAAAFLEVKMMYEYLKDDYVLLYSYARTKKFKLSVSKYYSSFACNMNKMKITDEELMAVADIVIADYDFTAFDFIAKDKPIFFYTPDLAVQDALSDSFIDYEEITDGLRFTDTTQLAKSIVNIDSYNYERLSNLKKNYFEYCDGKTSEKLIELMKNAD